MSRTPLVVIVAGTALVGLGGTIVTAGPLSPLPGPITSTYKTLGEVEPRIPISTLPYTINSPGSYYLTGNLSVAAGNGISITNTERVTLDLCGFSLVGQPGSSKGIVTIGTVSNVTIRNGTIHGWGVRGIEAGTADEGRFENVAFTGCALDGMMCGENSVVTGCIAKGNGEDGFDVGYNSVVSNCTAVGNGGDGFELDGYGVIVASTANVNGASGILAFSGTHISGCSAARNTGNGIFVSGTCTVLENACTGNGLNGVGAGIHASSGDSRIESNALDANDYGLRVLAAGNLIVRNSASGNPSGNYNIVAGNTVGPTVTAANIAASTNPHANYDF